MATVKDELLSAERQETFSRFRGSLSDSAPRGKNGAVAAMLAKAQEIDLTAEREDVRGVVDRVKRMFGRT